MPKHNPEEFISVNTALSFMIPLTALIVFGFYIVIDQHQTIGKLRNDVATIQHPEPVVKYILVKKVGDESDEDEKKLKKTLDPEFDKTIELINQANIKTLAQAKKILAKLGAEEELTLD